LTWASSSPWSRAVTETTETFRRLSFDLPDGKIAGIALGPEKPNPDIVFMHATSFNARTYRSLLAPLGDRFQVWALDARGHGRTPLPARTFGYTSWRRHRDDLIAVLDKHTSAPVTLAGHSMGATVSLLVAGKRNDLVAGLALLEPVILPASMYAMAQMPLGPTLMRNQPLARGARARRNSFTDRASAVDAFTGRGVFKAFPREVIEDYVADGLVDDGQGGFKLACRPGFEAATYCAQRNDPWGALRKVTDPLVLLRAERGSTITEASAHRFAVIKADARVATVEGAGHMLPMERPDRARAAIESAALLAQAGRKFNSGLE
jgi:pimeloyl-ACP methyl ester carboxylesterase